MDSGKQEAQMLKKAFIIGGIALMAPAVPTAPAAACHSSCSSTGSTGSTGGTPVPAPAGIGLFAPAAPRLIARPRPPREAPPRRLSGRIGLQPEPNSKARPHSPGGGPFVFWRIAAQLSPP